MKSHRLGLAIGAFLVGSGPPAAAQELCAAMTQLGALARQDFRSIDTGPARAGSMSHGTSLVLPGASRCWIRRRDGKAATYWCEWPSTPAAVGQQTLGFGASVAACVGAQPQWDQDPTSVYGFIEPSGLQYYVSGDLTDDGAEISLSVSLKE